MKKSEIYRAALVALRSGNAEKMRQEIWLEVISQLCDDWREAQATEAWEKAHPQAEEL